MAADSLLAAALEPQLSVQLQDVPLDALIGPCLLDVRVAKALNAADHVALRLAAWDSDSDRALWIDDSIFEPGRTLSVAMGYGGAVRRVFTGDIVACEMEMSGGERAVVSVDGYDQLHRLGRSRHLPQPQPESYGDLLRRIGQRVGGVRLESSRVNKLQTRVRRQNESELQLLSAVAADLACEFYLDDGKQLVFADAGGNRSPPVVLVAAELLEFSGRVDLASQIGSVNVSSFPDKREAKKNPESFDRAYGGSSVLEIQHQESTPEQDQLAASAELRRIREQYLSVSVTCLGRTDIRLGMRVVLGGISRRFDGQYNVMGIYHSWSPSQGFRTRLALKGAVR